MSQEQEIEALEAKIADLTWRLHPSKVAQKAVDLKLESPEMQALLARADDLRKQSDELSGAIVAPEIAEAKMKRFDWLHTDSLADGDIPKAQSIEAEKIQYLEDCRKLLNDIQNLNSQIEQIEAERKALLVPAFKEAFDSIKQGFASKLNFTVSWVERELQEFIQLQGDYEVKLFFNPDHEMRIFRETPWKELRDRLDRWLP